MLSTRFFFIYFMPLVMVTTNPGFSQRLNSGKPEGQTKANLMIICPPSQTESGCQTQSSIDAKFNSWLTTVSTTGGCDVSISSNAGTAPPACGGHATVTFTATSSCDPPATCSAVFSVTTAPQINLVCPTMQSETSCQNQSSIVSKFSNWLQTASFTGGCNAALSNNNDGPPFACGGSKTVNFTVSSTCEPPVSCSAVFSVTAAPAVALNCPGNMTVTACQTQTTINASYNAWLTSVSFSGGCKSSISNNAGSAPSACGGSTTVMWTVSSACEASVTCTNSFSVTNAPPITLICPPHQVENAGQSQTVIDAKFGAWLNLAGSTGGCNVSLSNNNSGAPPNTGGSTTVMWTVTSSCESPHTCSAYFTVKSASASSDPGLFEQVQLKMDYHDRRAWLHTSFAQTRAYSMRLYNTHGQVVWYRAACVTNENISIPLDNLCEGIYIIEMDAGKTRKILKLLVI